MPLHIGIVACSAEGAALCYRTICEEGPALMGTHRHPEVSMHTHSLGEYMDFIDRDDWQGVANLMLASAEKLENQYWQAIKDRDVDAAMRLTDYPCLVAGATGIGRVDKEAFAKMMKAASYRLHGFEIKDSEVRLLEDDVALVAYKVHEELTVDGEKVSMDAADSSVWVRRGGQWRCALHTESLAGDPYGRDRKKTGSAHS
jgi:ketosteroid isomerase-like protein